MENKKDKVKGFIIQTHLGYYLCKNENKTDYVFLPEIEKAILFRDIDSDDNDIFEMFRKEVNIKKVEFYIYEDSEDWELKWAKVYSKYRYLIAYIEDLKNASPNKAVDKISNILEMILQYVEELDKK